MAWADITATAGLCGLAEAAAIQRTETLESLWEAIMLDGQPLGEYPELGPTYSVEYLELLTLAYFVRLMGYRV